MRNHDTLWKHHLPREALLAVQRLGTLQAAHSSDADAISAAKEEARLTLEDLEFSGAAIIQILS